MRIYEIKTRSHHQNEKGKEICLKNKYLALGTIALNNLLSWFISAGIAYNVKSL